MHLDRSLIFLPIKINLAIDLADILSHNVCRGHDRNHGSSRPITEERAALKNLWYFTDGAVIGSRGFVEEVFQKSRDRFGPKRKDGARQGRSGGRCAVECEGFEEGGLKIQNPDTRHKTQDTRHKTQDTRHKTQDTRHKTQDTRDQ